MRVLRAFISALLVIVMGNPLAAQQRQTVTLPALGQVRATMSFPRGSLPTMTVFDAHGRVLLREKLGLSEPDLFRNDGASTPSFVATALLVIPPAEASPTVMLPLARYAGGSDCAYLTSPVSLHNGSLKPWFKVQPSFPAEGGVYVGQLGQGWGFGLAVWRFLWEDGAHPDPHRYEVDIYPYDPALGVAKKAAHRETRGKYLAPEQALAELGLRYENVLGRANEFSC